MDKRRLRLGRRGISGVALVVVMITGGLGVWLARPLWRSVVPASARRPAPPDRFVRVEIDVGGMDCILCAAGLQNKLRALPGVARAEVSYQARLARVEFDPARISRQQLEMAIQDSGFNVEDAGSRR